MTTVNVPARSLGQRLRKLRKAKGLTLHDVAHALRRSDRQIVTQWEQGKSQPRATEIPVIADLLGLSCDDLLRGSR